MIKKVIFFVIVFFNVSIAFSQSVNFTWNNPTCISPSNGEVTIELIGYVGTFEYTVINTVTNIPVSYGPTLDLDHTFSNLLPNVTYVVYVKNTVTGQTLSVDSKVLLPIPYVATANKIKGAGCHGEPVGIVGVSVTGGVPPYSYNWHGGVGPYGDISLVNDVPSDTYFVDVTDDVGCVITSTSAVVAPEDVIAAATIVNHVNCKGESTAEVTASASRYTAPISYEWDDLSTGASHTGLSAGNHFVVASDQFLCTDTAYFIITEPANKIQLTLDSKDDLLCKDINTGVANLSTLYGNAPLVYDWSDGGSGDSRIDLSALTYKVIVTDSTLCKDSVTFSLTQPATSIVGSIDNFTMPLCNGDANGTADISASGGTPGYTYEWNDANTDISRTDLISMEYIIVFTDANSCTDTLELDLQQPDKLLPTLVQQDNSPIILGLLCFADSVASKVVVDGGTLPIQSYVWNTPSIPNNTINVNLGAGFYKVIVTDANNCVDSVSITLTQPTELVNTVSVLNSIDCHGLTGSLQSNQVGGVLPYNFNWSNGEITKNTGDVVAGDYELVVTDNNGCKDTANITLTEPDTITHSITIDPAVCYDVTSGTISVQATGGTVSGDYSYEWSTLETNDTIGNLQPQIYTVTVTDDNNCSVSSFVDLSYVTDYTVSFEMSPVKCLGQSNGEAIATPVNGIAPYSFAWSNGTTDSTLSNVTEGWYTVTIIDGNGCPAIDSIYVTTIPSLYVSFSGIVETPCNQSLGAAYVEIAGGTQPYSYSWSNGGTTDSIINLPVDIYSVLITDVNGCTTFKSLEVIDTSSMKITASTFQNKIRCAGRADGEAFVTAVNGTAPYTYEWSTTETTDTIKNLLEGVYYVRATDDNGCKRVDSIQFYEENVFTIAIIDSSMVVCNGQNNGWALVSAHGGIAPYSISWSNGSTSNLTSDLVADMYTATITDANNCVLQDSVEITQPLPIVTTIDNVTDIKCKGINNAHASVLTSGGVSPYTYVWSSGETDPDALLLSGGKQYITITDNHACEHLDSVEIVDIIPKLAITVTETQSTCGFSDGELSVATSGGVGPYTYLWETGSTLSLIQNVPADAYTLLVQDANLCEIDTILTLNDFSTITATFDRQPITFCGPCNESYTATAANSVAPYSYEWSNGDIGQLADSLCTQLYSVTITDGNGCKNSIALNVIEKPIQINLVDKVNVNCYGKQTGELEVVAVNGVSSNYTYTWSNGGTGPLISNLPAGTYSVNVTEDLSICPAIQYYTITQNPELRRFYTTDIPSYCKDSTGQLHVDILGGSPPFTIAWETGEAGSIVHNAWNDFIELTIVDNLGCIVIDSAKVDDISNFSLSEDDRYLISCIGDSDGELEVALDNGYSPFTYSWDHNASVTTKRALGLPEGLYTVLVTDNRNCKVSYTFDSLTDPQQMNIVFTEPSPIFCNEGTGTVRANVTGGHPTYSYSWTFEGDPVATTTRDLGNMTTGDFTVVATDSRNCVSSVASYHMNEPPKIQAFFNVELTGCGSIANTGSIELDTIIGTNPPYRFRWHDETTSSTWFNTGLNRTKANLSAGEYYFTVLDTLGLCYNVFQNYTFPIVVSSIDTIIEHTHCDYYTDAEMTDRTPNGSIEILNFTTKKGDYSNLSEYETLTDFSDYSIEWEDPYNQTTPKASNLPEGDYYVNLIGENECVSRMSAGLVDAFVNLTNSIETVDDNIISRKTICLEDSIQLQANSSQIYTHSYAPANTLIGYTWTSKAKNSLTDLSSLTSQKVWANPLTNYYNDSTLIEMQYLFDGCTSPISQFVINHFDSIDFKLEVLDSFENYLGEDSVFAILNEQFLINPTEEPWYVSKPANQDGILSIAWSSEDAKNQKQGQLKDTITDETTFDASNMYGLQLTAKSPSYYYAVATTTNGCKQNASVFVNVYSSVFVPTGITPNGDGQNDTWIIPYLYLCPNAVIKVYNRWGEKLYESESTYYLNPWNGSIKNGKQLPMGTYYYIIEYNDENKTPPQAGAISILY